MGASPLARLLRQAHAPAAGRVISAADRAAAEAEGVRLSIEEAVAYATRSRGRRGRPSTGWDSLTPTEHAVAALTAHGLSNPAIAAELLVMTGTVRSHLRSVFVKLAVTSRAELAAVAARRGL